MADYNEPVLTSSYVSVLSVLKLRDVDAITLCLVDPTNIPTGAIKFNRSTNGFQEWDGAAWQNKPIGITGGGTGATTAAGARTALGLGSMSVQDSNAVAISGGAIGGVVDIDATRLTSGLVAQSRLGSGSGGTGSLFLADNQTWLAAVGVLSGSGMLWYGSSAPSGYLLCDGSAISRVTYSVLFGILGTAYGVGDGSTTFNLPDLRQRFPLGKAASGTGNTLGTTGGVIDHNHTSVAHTHTVASHTHGVGSFAGPSHTHTIAHTHNFTMGGPTSVHSANSGVVFQAADVDHHHDGVTDGVNTPDSGASGTGAITGTSGATALTTDSTTPGVGGTNNPPYQVVNYIIKT